MSCRRYKKQTKVTTTKHVCFGLVAMQQHALRLLLYCLTHTRRCDVRRHQIGLNLGECWSECLSKIWRGDSLSSCFCNMGSRKGTSFREVSTQRMQHVLIIKAKVHPLKHFVAKVFGRTIFAKCNEAKIVLAYKH